MEVESLWLLVNVTTDLLDFSSLQFSKQPLYLCVCGSTKFLRHLYLLAMIRPLYFIHNHKTSRKSADLLLLNYCFIFNNYPAKSRGISPDT